MLIICRILIKITYVLTYLLTYLLTLSCSDTRQDHEILVAGRFVIAAKDLEIFELSEKNGPQDANQ